MGSLLLNSPFCTHTHLHTQGADYCCIPFSRALLAYSAFVYVFVCVSVCDVMPLSSLHCLSIFTVLSSISTQPACISEPSLPYRPSCFPCFSFFLSLSWYECHYLQHFSLIDWVGLADIIVPSPSLSFFLSFFLHPFILMLIHYVHQLDQVSLFCFLLQTTHQHSLKHLERQK